MTGVPPGASGRGKVARGGPGAGASEEAARAPGLSRLLLPSQPQSGVRQAGEREDGDAAPLRDGERRPRAGGGGGSPGTLKRGPPQAAASPPQGSPGSRCRPTVPRPSTSTPPSLARATCRRVGERRGRKRNPSPGGMLERYLFAPFICVFKVSQRAGCPILASKIGLDQPTSGLDKISFRDLLGVFGNFAALQPWDLARVGQKPSPPPPCLPLGFVSLEEPCKALCLHSPPSSGIPQLRILSALGQ